MTILEIYMIASTVFASLWAVLKIIAPYTKSKKDDKIVKIISELMKHFSIKVEDKKLAIEIRQK